MQVIFDTSAPRKPANVSINSDLLAQALADKVAQVQREQWLKENQQAINGYNQRVDEQGVFSEGIRAF